MTMLLPRKDTSRIALYMLAVACGALAVIFIGLCGEAYQTPVIAESTLREQPRASTIVLGQLSDGREAKTTCFTGVECKGAIRQGLKVGDIAMAGVPLGTRVKIIETGMTYTVATRPDSKTDIDVFYGNEQSDYERCLERGVKYYHYEIL